MRTSTTPTCSTGVEQPRYAWGSLARAASERHRSRSAGERVEPDRAEMRPSRTSVPPRPASNILAVAIQPSEPALSSRDRDVRAAGRTSSRAHRCGHLVRRVLGITSLATLDTVGLALGLYLALVLRELLFGDPTSSGASSGGRSPRSGCRSSSRSRCSSSGRRGSTPRASAAPVSGGSRRRSCSSR